MSLSAVCCCSAAWFNNSVDRYHRLCVTVYTVKVPRHLLVPWRYSAMISTDWPAGHRREIRGKEGAISSEVRGGEGKGSAYSFTAARHDVYEILGI